MAINLPDSQQKLYRETRFGGGGACYSIGGKRSCQPRVLNPEKYQTAMGRDKYFLINIHRENLSTLDLLTRNAKGIPQMEAGW